MGLFAFALQNLVANYEKRLLLKIIQQSKGNTASLQNEFTKGVKKSCLDNTNFPQNCRPQCEHRHFAHNGFSISQNLLTKQRKTYAVCASKGLCCSAIIQGKS